MTPPKMTTAIRGVLQNRAKILFLCGVYAAKVGTTSAREVFGHIELVKILVILSPTGYMLTSSRLDALFI